MTSQHRPLPRSVAGSSSSGSGNMGATADAGLALPPAPSPVQVRSSYSFTTGIIIGQASVFVLLFLVVRYVVFEDGKAGMKRKAARAKAAGGSRKRRPSHLTRLSSAPPPPVSSAQLLSKAGYDISSHPAESMDWLNVLFAQVASNYRASLLAHKGEEGARQKVEEWLNPAQGVSWLDPIQVTALTLGSSYPLFSNARIRPSDASGRLRAETELEYSDSVTLAITTGLVINYPRPRFAVLPISLGVTLVGLHGTMTVELLSSPTSAQSPTPHQALQLSLHPDFELDLSTTSLLGSRAKLQDLPKIEQLVASRLRQALVERVVWPRFWAIGLPGLGIGVARTAATEPVPTDGEEEDHDATAASDVDEDEDEWEPVVQVAKNATSQRRRSSAASGVRRRETGLGGGVRTMPGGSDWGVGGM